MTDLLPNLIVIGAMKTGTSSLQFYLRQHPEVFMSAEKELNFFVEDRAWGRGVAWYRSQFRNATVRGEASPNYSAVRRFPGVPARMHSVVPDAKLIYIVRDPIQRAISHWIHNFSDGTEDAPFEEAVRRWIYVERSLYWRQLSAFLEFYPPERILVFTSDELRHERIATLERVFRFLGVDPTYRSPRFHLVRHRSSLRRRSGRAGRRLAASRVGRAMTRLPQPFRWQLNHLVYYPLSRPIERPVMSRRTRQWFVEQVRDDVADLGAYMGRELSGWLDPSPGGVP
ncbi:MAG: sulfotransferase [Gemmatimonadota bacterium]|nr:sulfotransferase [Gemmatimonadota bacterium]